MSASALPGPAPLPPFLNATHCTPAWRVAGVLSLSPSKITPSMRCSAAADMMSGISSLLQPRISIHAVVIARAPDGPGPRSLRIPIWPLPEAASGGVSW